MKKFTLSLSLIAFLFSGCENEARKRAEMSKKRAEMYNKLIENRISVKSVIDLGAALFMLKSDTSEYYQSKKKLPNKFSDMIYDYQKKYLNDNIISENGLNISLGISGEITPCINVSIIKEGNKPFLKVEKVSNPSEICKSAYEYESIKKMLDKKEIPLQ